MSKICEHCGAKPLVGNMRSHSNRATKRRWNVNLQKTTVEGKSMRLCANCMKTLQKAPR